MEGYKGESTGPQCGIGGRDPGVGASRSYRDEEGGSHRPMGAARSSTERALVGNHTDRR